MKVKRARSKLQHQSQALVTNDVKVKNSLRQQSEEGLRLLSPIEVSRLAATVDVLIKVMLLQCVVVL